MKLTITLFLLLISLNIYAQIIHVPADQPTIQAGIDSASFGDTVLVADNIYYENINFKGKGITLASQYIIDSDTNHIYNTVINGSQPANSDSGSVVYFVSGEDSSSILIGFTITGGTGTEIFSGGIEKLQVGGGILLRESGAKIQHNHIKNNSVEIIITGSEQHVASGGAIDAESTIPVNIIIENNWIDSNFVKSAADAFGGGIIIAEETSGIIDARITNNKITNNIVETTGAENVAVGGGIVISLSKFIVSLNEINFNKTSAVNSNTGAAGIGSGLVLGFLDADETSVVADNKIVNNSLSSGVSLGGGLDFTFANSPLVVNNYIQNNEATVGGGFFSQNSTPILIRNLITSNIASSGGGAQIEQYEQNNPTKLSANSSLYNEFRKAVKQRVNKRKSTNIKNVLSLNAVEIINNTIVNNTIDLNSAGPGLFIFNANVQITNSIIWGNQPGNTPQIDGPAYITYSDVQGGYPGVGNLNSAPLFADMQDYYLTPSTSPCIDAGNPDSIYNDIEDPLNPGFAQLPSLGTLINDIGAWGGNPNSYIDREYLGPLFNDFVARVNSAPSLEKPAIIDSFINAVPSIPFIENNSVAYFIYRGNALSVSVPGDANGWDANQFPMTNIDETSFWFKEAVFEPDARLDYKFVINGSSWILDPLNPNQVSGGFGPNSELAMPDYVQPVEIEFNAGIPHGTISSFSFFSNTLSNSRTIRIYTPPGYASSPNRRYPIILFHDGQEFLSLANADNVFDYLIHEDRIDPLIGIFVPPVNRDNEYAFNQTAQFETFIINELMPHIDSTYRTISDPANRIMLGISFGGLITTQICYNNPQSFGLAAPMSPSYWANNMAVYNSVVNGPKKDIKWYLDWGTYELGIMINGRAFRDELISKSYDIDWKEWHEGHSWGSWRAHLDNALEYLLPVGATDVLDEQIAVKNYHLTQNYPNPFNPTTIIEYAVPERAQINLRVFDILGNEVATLVNEGKSKGIYRIEFDGSGLSSGVYFYQIQANDFISTRKMILIK
jgi:enterochelin esterase-like enzyme